MQTNVALQIREFIRGNFLFGAPLAVDDDESLIDAGVIDSTGVLELIGFLEERFGIVVADADIVPENLDSINAIVRYTAGGLATGAAA